MLTKVGTTLYDPIYCFESCTNSQYFYTLDKYTSGFDKYSEFTNIPTERDALLSDPDNWSYRGIAFCVWDSNTSDPNQLKAICRFVHKELGTPVYTITKSEFDNDSDWECDDEEAFFAYPRYTGDQQTHPEGTYPPGEEPEGTIPVYRFWSESFQCHFYWINEAEKDDVPAISGWTYKGIAWYAHDKPKP